MKLGKIEADTVFVQRPVSVDMLSCDDGMEGESAQDDVLPLRKRRRGSEASQDCATRALDYDQARAALAAAASAAAEKEGLPLLRSANLTGFKGVGLNVRMSKNPFVVSKAGVAKAYLGYFRTAEEAALAYSRYIGKAALLEMLAAEQAAHIALTEEQVRCAAADEGLELVTDPHNKFGFRGVQYNVNGGDRPYYARASHGEKQNQYLGWFTTKHEAALAYARHLGRNWFLAMAEKAAEKAAAAEANAAAAEAKMREKERREEAAKMRREKAAKNQRVSKEKQRVSKEEVKARKAAERTALQAELLERQRRQAEHQRRLLQEAAASQRQRQSTGGASRGAAAPGDSTAAAAAGAPPVDADGPIDDLVAMVLAGAAPTLDPLSCLGLPPASVREQARKRYLQLVLRLHPDKCDHPSADAAFKRVEEAWRFIEARADVSPV